MVTPKFEIARENAFASNLDQGADERFWAEVRARLAEMERRRRSNDAFSREEERALALAAGAMQLLEKVEAGAHQRERAGAEANRAQAELAAQIHAAVERAEGRPLRWRGGEFTPRAPARKRYAASGGRGRKGARAPAFAGLAFLLALVLGAWVFWLRPEPAAIASARWQGEPAGAILKLKLDADAAGFAARASARR